VKVLSIRQPWAWLIVNGYKDIENRTWYTSYRGRFLVHASRNMTRNEWDSANLFVREFAPDVADKMPNPQMFGSGLSGGMLDGSGLGGIVGEATILNCVQGFPSEWFCGPYGFVLTDARTLPFLPCRGHLGFTEVEEGS
jgi:hypothetical protein